MESPIKRRCGFCFAFPLSTVLSSCSPFSSTVSEKEAGEIHTLPSRRIPEIHTFPYCSSVSFKSRMETFPSELSGYSTHSFFPGKTCTLYCILSPLTKTAKKASSSLPLLSPSISMTISFADVVNSMPEADQQRRSPFSSISVIPNVLIPFLSSKFSILNYSSNPRISSMKSID